MELQQEKIVILLKSFNNNLNSIRVYIKKYEEALILFIHKQFHFVSSLSWSEYIFKL